MKCNQWKQFKQQCENSCFRLQQMITKKDIEFMDVGVIKEEESDNENNFDATNCGFDDDQHSYDSGDEKEKLAEIITELNPVCEIKKEFLSFELKNLDLKLKKFPTRVKNPNLILTPMKMVVKKTTDISDLDQDEFNTISKTETSSVVPPQPTRNLQKRKSTKISYADDDDDDDNNSGNDNESDNDISYRKRPTFIYKCKTCRKKFSGCNVYEIHYVTAHMTNKEVSEIKYIQENLYNHWIRLGNHL